MSVLSGLFWSPPPHPTLPPALPQVHPDILPYTEESVRKKGVQTLSQLEQLYNKEVRV